MPVKKTVKKTTAAKPAAKKVVSAPAPKANSKPTVVVETKKTNTASKCVNSFEKTMKVVILSLLLLNLVFVSLNLFKKDSALKLEELKVWGSSNFQKVVELYNSDAYKAQQTAAIQQFMWWQQ